MTSCRVNVIPAPATPKPHRHFTEVVDEGQRDAEQPGKVPWEGHHFFLAVEAAGLLHVAIQNHPENPHECHDGEDCNGGGNQPANRRIKQPALDESLQRGCHARGSPVGFPGSFVPPKIFSNGPIRKAGA